ncbi:MAG: VaFE repeat-containing surface-anchored protein, partial [Lachnospiraceae bacterium]|nr:VaFE repeat-containing surface-anchored protein [Lachnospiraceae bacterium]
VDLTLVTDEDGQATAEGIPYGTYILEELLSEEQEKYWIQKSTDTVTLSDEETEVTYTLANEQKTGIVHIRKAFLDDASYEGVSLAGFVFRLHGTSDLGSEVDLTLVTDADGQASAEGIPYGTYALEETLTDAQAERWHAPLTGTVVLSDETPEVVYRLVNEQKKGSVRIEKAFPDGGFYEGVSLAGFVFRLHGTSDLGSTVHVTLVTDEHGQASAAEIPYGTYLVEEVLTEEQQKLWTAMGPAQVTVSDAHPEVTYTLRNVQKTGAVRIVKCFPDAPYYAGLSPAGFTFRLHGISELGSEVDVTLVTDAHGNAYAEGIPYGTYALEEVLTEAQRSVWAALSSGTVTVAEQAVLSDETPSLSFRLENRLQMLRLGSELLDARTGRRLAAVSEDASVYDVLRYEQLRAGLSYKVLTTLWYVPDGGGAPVEIAAEETLFTPGPDAASETGNPAGEPGGDPGNILCSGQVTVAFAPDLTPYRDGGTLRSENTLYVRTEDGWALIARHNEDLADARQSIVLPYIRTGAQDADTGTRSVCRSDRAVIEDRVSYGNLLPGETYRVRGVLVLKETGRPLLDETGTEIQAEVEFTAEKAEGTVTLAFTLDTRGLAGQTVVVFEYLSFEGVPVCEHADPEAEAQTVTVPAIGTTAESKPADASGAVTILTDTVRYTGLTPGEMYVVRGQVMDRESGLPAGVQEEVTFIPDAPDGVVEVLFRIPTDPHRGRALVLFETVYDAHGHLMAEHADLHDIRQTVLIPDIVITGDASHLGLHTGIFTGAGGLLLMMALQRRRRRESR